MNQLAKEFLRIKVRHRDAMLARVARGVLGPSVVRVFMAGTKPGLAKALEGVPVDELPKVVRSGTFDDWYEGQLERVASEIRVRNADNPRVLPGLKWGHAAKVLSLFLRDVVENARYFSDRDARTIGRVLHVPVDGIVIERMRSLEVTVPCRQIKAIDTRDLFWQFQKELEAAAKVAGVPRIWFDDNWADRQ